MCLIAKIPSFRINLWTFVSKQHGPKKKLCGIKNENLQNLWFGPKTCGQETEMNDKAFLSINFELCTVRLS